VGVLKLLCSGIHQLYAAVGINVKFNGTLMEVYKLRNWKTKIKKIS